MIVALGVAAAAAAAAAVLLSEAAPTRAALGICAVRPPGWEEVSVPRGYSPFNVASVGLLNWHETDRTVRYPRNAIEVWAANDGPDERAPRVGHVLRVAARDFAALDNGDFFEAAAAARRGDRVIGGSVRLGAVTPASVAAANRLLAGIRLCAAWSQPYLAAPLPHG